MFRIRKFEVRGGNALFNAQQNLCERTHYVDDDSLRFHKQREFDELRAMLTAEAA